MRQEFSASLGTSARAIVVALAGIALAHCSAPNYSGSNSGDDAERVTRSTGRYSVGKPYSINGETYVPTENPKYRAEGVASWYGPDFHGGPTANGERYDMHGISAAHPTMPLPSYARVTNLENGRSIIVRVNNRGPFVHNRLADLSIGAAKALNFYRRGTAHIRMEYVGRAPIEGSDDEMLLATLRVGTPAPAPSKVRVASAKPFMADASNAKAQRPTGERQNSTGSISAR
jgi:peptidoglycan lytic transglycosylase